MIITSIVNDDEGEIGGSGKSSKRSAKKMRSESAKLSRKVNHPTSSSYASNKENVDSAKKRTVHYTADP